MPPCLYAFTEHVQRVVWQCRVWFLSLVAQPDYGNAGEYGWIKKDSIFQPVYFTGQNAAEKLDSLVCSCKDSCTRWCSCRPCIELCGCEGDCTNDFEGDEDEDD